MSAVTCNNPLPRSAVSPPRYEIHTGRSLSRNRCRRMAAQPAFALNFRKLKLSKIETAGPLRSDPVARSARSRNCETTVSRVLGRDANIRLGPTRGRNFTYPSGSAQLTACKRDSGVFRIVEGYQCRKPGDREEVVNRGRIDTRLAFTVILCRNNFAPIG